MPTTTSPGLSSLSSTGIPDRVPAWLGSTKFDPYTPPSSQPNINPRSSAARDVSVTVNRPVTNPVSPAPYGNMASRSPVRSPPNVGWGEPTPLSSQVTTNVVRGLAPVGRGLAPYAPAVAGVLGYGPLLVDGVGNLMRGIPPTLQGYRDLLTQGRISQETADALELERARKAGILYRPMPGYGPDGRRIGASGSGGVSSGQRSGGQPGGQSRSGGSPGSSSGSRQGSYPPGDPRRNNETGQQGRDSQYQPSPNDPYNGGSWTPSPGIPIRQSEPQGAEGIYYNVGYYGVVEVDGALTQRAGPAGGIALGPWRVVGIGTTAISLLDANGQLVSNLLSGFYPYGAWELVRADPLTEEPPRSDPSPQPRPNDPPPQPPQYYPPPPPPPPNPNPRPQPKPEARPNPRPSPDGRYDPGNQGDPGGQGNPGGQNDPRPQPRPSPTGGTGTGPQKPERQGVPDEVVEYQPGYGPEPFPGFKLNPQKGTYEQSATDAEQAINIGVGVGAVAVAATGIGVLVNTRPINGQVVNPVNPTTNGIVNWVPAPNPSPSPAPGTTTGGSSPSPVSCRYDGLGISGKVDNANTVLSAVQVFQQQQIMGKLNTIDDKLGAKIPDGGIGGLLTRLWDFSKKAWEMTRLDKVMNALNFLIVLHNAAMLSRNLGETLGDLTGQALSVIGIKDHEGNAIDINQVLGGQANTLMSTLLGAEVWSGIKENFNKASRILSAASNIVWTIRSIADSTREITEWIAENTGKIGNALKRWRVVGENAYAWMPERINAQNAWMRKVERFRSGVDSLDDAASSFSSVLGEVQNVQQEGQELLEQYQRFNQAVESLEPKERQKNVPVFDREKQNKQDSAAPSPITSDDKAKGDAP